MGRFLRLLKPVLLRTRSEKKFLRKQNKELLKQVADLQQRVHQQVAMLALWEQSRGGECQRLREMVNYLQDAQRTSEEEREHLLRRQNYLLEDGGAAARRHARVVGKLRAKICHLEEKVRLLETAGQSTVMKEEMGPCHLEEVVAELAEHLRGGEVAMTKAYVDELEELVGQGGGAKDSHASPPCVSLDNCPGQLPCTSSALPPVDEVFTFSALPPGALADEIFPSSQPTRAAVYML